MSCTKNYNNLTVIDPNCFKFNNVELENGIPNFEDLRSFVELSMIPRNSSYIEISDDNTVSSVGNSKNSSAIKLLGVYTRESDGKEYFSTNYTDELAGNLDSNKKNYEGFGIKNLEITLDANKVPQISVTFYDLKGNVLNDFNSKFAKMFHLPYPIFKLRIKGGYGPLFEYELAKTRDDISIDENGNYIITSKFIGNKFAPFSDMPLLYLMAVPYLRNEEINLTDNEIKSFHEFIINNKQLYEKLNQETESQQEQSNKAEIEKIDNKIAGLVIVRDFLSDLENIKTFFKEENTVVKNYINLATIDNINKKITLPTLVGKSSTDGIRITTIIRDDIINSFNTKLQTYDATYVNLVKGELSNIIVNGKNSRVYSVIDFKEVENQISKEEAKKNSKANEGSNNFRNKLTNLIDLFLGNATPTVGNIFKFILNDYNFLVEQIKIAGDAGIGDVVRYDNNPAFDRIGFPTVIKSNTIVYPPVADPNFKNWSEIIFVENFLKAYTEALKNNLILDTLLSTNKDGSSKYIPINPREVYKNAPNELSFVKNVYSDTKTLQDISNLIFERYLIYSNINTSDTNYDTPEVNQSVFDNFLEYFKDFFNTSGKDGKERLARVMFNLSNEARNIAFAISSNDNFKNYFIELSKSIKTVDDVSIFLLNKPNDPFNVTWSNKDKIRNENPLKYSNYYIADDDYVIAFGPREKEPTLITNTNPEDIIGKYTKQLSEQNEVPYKFTSNNIPYISDDKLNGNTLESDYDKNKTSDKPLLDFSFIQKSADKDKNPLQIQNQIDNNEYIYTLFSYSINNPKIVFTPFDFPTFIKNCSYPGLIQVPRGMLISLGGLLYSYNKDKPDEIIYSIYTDADSDNKINIIKDSKIYKFLIKEYFSFIDKFRKQNSSGQLIYTYLLKTEYDYTHLILRPELTALYASGDRTIVNDAFTAEVRQYLYDKMYISVNDFTFVNQNTLNFNLKITNTSQGDEYGLYNIYLLNLIQQTANFLKEEDAKLKENLKAIESSLKDNDVKLTVYKSFQVIYETYLANVPKENVKIELDSFKFIDRANNDIQNRCILDTKSLINDVEDTDVSLLSAISRLLSDNNFWFYPFQSFSTSPKDFTKIFDIMYEDATPTKPVFLGIYVGGLSSNPANNGDRKEFSIGDDGITDLNNLPTDFASNSGINVFLAQYTGRQNQMVFSNFQHSTEQFKNTDESLKIQSQIVGNASNSFSIPKGQSLLNVYQKQSYTSTIKIPFGNIGIQPTMYYFQEFIPLFDGLYIIYNVSHSIDSDTQRLETTFKGYRLKRDVNPIITQPFVDFYKDSFYSSALNSFGYSDLILTTGSKLDPIKNLIAKGESFGGDYEVYNYGKNGGKGAKTVRLGVSVYDSTAIKLTDKTLAQIRSLQDGSDELFAVGKYQIIPSTLETLIKRLNINKSNTLFDKNTQEVLGDSILFTSRPAVGAYLKGKNSGTQKELENAVQELGQEFASLPIINKTKNGSGNFGSVVTGIGNKGYYGGTGVNPDIVDINVKSVVQALITSRLQYSSNRPSFIPNYYINITNNTTLPNNDASVVTIGDSLSVGLSTVKKNVISITSPVKLNTSGWRVDQLLQALKNTKISQSTISKVIVSIGANNGYELTGLEEKLMNEIDRVFPNATKYICNGSYGWLSLKVEGSKTDAYWKSKIGTFLNKFTTRNYIIVGEVVKESGHPQPNNNDPYFASITQELRKIGIA